MDDRTGERTAREFLADELRVRREAHELTQQQLGDALFVSRTQVAHMERGARRMLPFMAEQVDEIFGTGELFQRLAAATIGRSGHPNYYTDAVEAEQTAEFISHYAPTLVPGLLQIEPYVHALASADDLFTEADEVAATVRARIARAAILHQDDPVRLWVVLHEAVLRTEIGGPEVMAAQLGHIATLARDRQVVVQVVSFSEGAHRAMSGMAAIYEFTDAAPMVYCEGPFTGVLTDDPAVVVVARRAYDLARAVALPPEASLTLIESVAKEYVERCGTTT
ncbi:Scr1 family TA system antitoxin-like transcriptional regulator [Streptomyces sp. NPDC058953]|uniref:helix-turn-helix domain-containing protein n=1 Tax=unclassified Streptomyces TaxID=2593676 RepID=UPI00368D35A7